MKSAYMCCVVACMAAPAMAGTHEQADKGEDYGDIYSTKGNRDIYTTADDRQGVYTTKDNGSIYDSSDKREGIYTTDESMKSKDVPGKELKDY